MIEEVAPAKVNLFLHVGPILPSGLHAIESLFVFCDRGDVLRAAPASDVSLTLSGPFSRDLSHFPITDNLVLKAANALRSNTGSKSGAALHLDKRLPIASGIGGGSADAAAALRALAKLWRADMGPKQLGALAFTLGSDIPACLDAAPIFVSGAGERIEPGPRLPPLWIALANPNVPMPTGLVFRDFDLANPSPAQPDPARCTRLASYSDLRDYLSRTRNDLERSAMSRAPVIKEAAQFLGRQTGCLFSRMSGSGATVFGLYSSPGAAEGAAAKAKGMGWWSMAARVVG